ncbi:MAG: hypothetical protein V4651_04975 [Bacteroidota bacterium]
MYTLSDQQIDFILDDIRRNGIELEDLQYNLLDHVCCIIERELEANGDFERFYQSTIRTFYNGRLAELEEETHSLLTFKHYYTMKKLMIVSGIFSAVVFSFGILFKFNHWPGASALIAGGILSLSFIFLPLYFTLKIQEKKETKDKVLAGLTSLVCIGMSLSVLFKVMHWPGANMLGMGSLMVLALLFLPVYFITGIRNPDTKMNTILSSVLIIGGCGLFLTLVSSPRATRIKDEFIASNFVRNELILQSELRMLNRMKAKDSTESNNLAHEIISLCEAMKGRILLGETGCANPVGDNSCKADIKIRDGLVIEYFSGERSLQPQLDILTTKIKQYNRQLDKHYQQQVLEETLLLYRNETTIPGYLDCLRQTEMFVLQNERELLAAQ